MWNFDTQQASPGAGHNPRVMAGAWARVGQGSSCWALCRCCGSAGLTPELSRHAERARRWDDLSASAETAKRTRLERIVSPQTCFCGLSQRCGPEPLVTVWNFHTQQRSPGAGHNPRVMAGAWARAGQGSSCWALCRCCGSAGLTPELSRRSVVEVKQWQALFCHCFAGTKRSRLERIVRARPAAHD